jgi:hypothetical protein
MTHLSPELAQLGDALERAAEADLARARRWRLPRKVLLAAAAIAIGVPGLAVAASRLIGPGEVAQSLPAGTRMLEGTEPRCTVVKQDVEYYCVLAKPIAKPEVSDLKGTVEPTVDDSKHVDGGCRSLTSDGREWQCYIGRAAVEQRIISADFLGEYAPVPGVG